MGRLFREFCAHFFASINVCLFLFLAFPCFAIDFEYSARYFDPELNVDDAWRKIETPLKGEKVLSLGRVVKGSPVQRELFFRIQNTSSSAVTLSSWQLPSGFSWGASKASGPTQVAAGSSVTFSVIVKTDTVGKGFGDLSFVSSDNSATPQKISLEIEVKE